MAVVWSEELIEGARQKLRHAEPPYPSLAADGWLAQSLETPPPLASLLSFLGTRMTPFKSHPLLGCELFHDLVARHRDLDQEVFREYSHRDGWRSLTLRALAARSSRLATAWARRGVLPGQRLALVLPLSAEYLVALLTALRMGLLICPLPPRGSLLLAQRLKALAPDHVYTTALYAPMLRSLGSKIPELLVDEPGEMAHESYYTSFTYAPETPVLALFSPLTETAEKPTELFGETLLTALLLDYLFTFAAEPQKVLAAPGSHPEQYQPGLLLLALLGGLVYVHVELAALAENPLLLADAPITHLVASCALRDVLLAAPRGLLPRLQCLLRDPLESPELGAWQRMLAAQGWSKLPVGNLIYDSAAGGALLFSARALGAVHNQLLPAAGRPYLLQAADGSRRPSLGGSGTFVRQGAKSGFIALGRFEDQFYFGGTLTPRRSGRVYPESAALQAVSHLPFVDGAAFVVMPCDDGSGSYRVVLCVLCASESRASFAQSAAKRRDMLRQCLRSKLDEEFVPDEIELFPVLARRKEGAVDINWLKSEFLSGALHGKAQDPRLHTLYTLMSACRNTPLDRIRAAAAGNHKGAAAAGSRMRMEQS